MAHSNKKDVTNPIGIVKEFENTLKSAIAQLTSDLPSRENINFNKEEFWRDFESVIKLISHEATKFCMAFENKCEMSNEECQPLIDGLEKACLSVLSVFLRLSKTQGIIFHSRIRSYVLDILGGVLCLCTAVETQRTGLRDVGDVWAHCEAVENLPKDNCDAVFRLCEDQYQMVNDAVLELMDAIENENTDDTIPTQINGFRMSPPPSWNSADRNILLPCSGLLKAARACVKKTTNAISARGDGSREETINELDQVANIVKNSSSLADDFVLSLYPPINHSVAREQGMCVRNNSKELLQIVRNSHFCSPTDEDWVEFLEKAVDHNWARINDMVLVE